MNSVIANYQSRGFCVFTLDGITLNDNNKKQLYGMPNWKDINKTNFREYCFDQHRALVIRTGNLSGITCLDFDVKEGKCSYEKVVQDYPELKAFKTVKTQSGGFHIYCSYDVSIKTTTNAFKEYENIDIRNDDAVLFAPPTKVYKNRQCVGVYEDLGGEILPFPEGLKQKLKQFIPTTPPKAPLSIIQPCLMPSSPEHSKDITNKNVSVVKQIAEAILSIDNKYFDDYEKWSYLGYIIFNETDGSEEGETLFNELSKSSIKYENKQSVKKQYYNTQKSRDKKLTMDCMFGWLEKLQPNHPLLKGRLKTKFASTDDEASDILYNELKHVFKSYKGRLFYLHNHIWSHDENIIDDIVLNYILKCNIYSGINEKTQKPIPFTQNISKAKKVQEALYSKIRVLNNDDELYEKFHTTTKGIICFNDGILHFQNKTFTFWEDVKENTIFPTVKINRNYHDYFINPNLDDIKNIKEKIFNVLYGDKTDLALQFLSRALAGHHEDKRWATYLGNRNSGKGVEYDLLATAFEGYVSTFELGNMLYSRKTAGTENVDCSKKLYWLIDLEFVRLAVSQEIPDCNSGLQVNGKMLKKITGGGDVIVARRNYDRKDTHFKIDTSFYIKGNNSLECDTVDCNETRLEFSSVTQFKTAEEIEFMKQEGRDEMEMKRYKVADPTIKDTCKTMEWRNAVIYLILQHYSHSSVEIPKLLNVEDNSLLGCLKDTFEFSYNNDDCILCNDLHAVLNSFDKGKIALELSALNIFKKKATKGIHRNKWCYFGIKEKKDEQENNTSP